MASLIITESAKEDIKEALTYIKNELGNPNAASDLADEITEQINSLAEFPKSCPLVKDTFLANYGIRFLLIKNYKAYYIFNNNEVTIIRFLHSRRDYETILSKEI